MANLFLEAINEKMQTDYPLYTEEEMTDIIKDDPSVITPFMGLAEVDVPLGVIAAADIGDVTQDIDNYLSEFSTSLASLIAQLIDVIIGY